VDTEYTIFQKQERDKYFCGSVSGEDSCLIYSECVAVSKEYNKANHNLKHTVKCRNCTGVKRREKVRVLVRGD